MEQFDFIEEKDAINSTQDDFDKCSRYKINNINSQLSINFTRIKNKSNYGSKKRCCIFRIPYICFIDILVFIITLGTTIAYIIIKYKYIENYKFIDYEVGQKNIYLKPKSLEHDYSRIVFDNGMIIVLGKIHPNDTAHGAIAFDKGYLNDEYKPGYLNFALNVLISDLKNNKTKKGHLSNYIGKIKYSEDEDYSSFYFNILNNGFLNYLRYFSELLYLKEEDKEKNEEKDERLNNNYINKLLNQFPESDKNIDKENHLLEFLIYGCKNDKGEEILPQGKKDELKKNLGNNFEEIEEIMKGLLNSPSKIRILLFSHYKFSIIKKTILRYFKIVFKNTDNNQNKNEENNLKDFDTNKIIYYGIDDDENNYLKINFYIDNINISDKQQFHIDSKYFNYIKDVLLETKNDSLYDELTHDNFNMSIKSISSNINIILKSKIIFSIKIELNRRSYNHIKEIIKKVYEYIEKIKKYINNLNEEDERIRDLFYLYKQDFHYTEEKDDLDDFSQKAKKLFYLDDYFYFLKEDWFPYNFKGNLHKIKEYFNQLTMNNSVIILGINDYTKNIFFNKSNISFIFENNNITKYFNLSYTCNDLSKLNLTLNLTDDDKIIKFTNNSYISSLDENAELFADKSDIDKYFDNETEKINSTNSDTYRFFYFRDTSFKIPKVYTSLFIFHPFSRPNLTETENNNLYFKFIMFISYLKIEINNRLADALRAGSVLKVDFSENFIYIDVYCFYDIVKDILKMIKKIISDSNTIIKENYEIYRDYALEILNSKGKSFDDILKLEFYKYIYDELPFYNYYKFPIDEFKNKTISLNESLNSFIMQVYIYGYISKEDSLEICNIFEKENSNNDSFLKALEIAGLNNNNININNFVKKMLNKKEIKENIIINNTKEINNKIYFYKRMSKFNFKNSVYAYIIEDIFDENDIGIVVGSLTQKYIHLKIICQDYSNCTKQNITETLIEEIKKSNLNETIDLIGDRFYYYSKNTQNYIAQKHENLESAARYKSYENLYDRFDKNEDIDYFDISFEEFINKISELNKDFPNNIIFE